MTRLNCLGSKHGHMFMQVGPKPLDPSLGKIAHEIVSILQYRTNPFVTRRGALEHPGESDSDPAANGATPTGRNMARRSAA